MENSRTYSLADLNGWAGRHDGKSLAVVGFPIKHSISPAMHNAALAQMALREPAFLGWNYVRFEVPPTELDTALEAFLAEGFQGLNLTVPHKVIAFNHRLVSPRGNAREIGAVNTLVATGPAWSGHNTDGHGLAAGISEDLSVSLTGADIILLGAGGAARGAAVECLARHCASLSIGNRTRANLDALMIQLAPLSTRGVLRTFDPSAAADVGLPENAIVINATSSGLKLGDPLPLELAAIPRPRAVYDMIYNPEETAFLAAARRLGIPAANGLSMLVHQGAEALEIWSGRAGVPIVAMRAAAQRAMRHPKN